MGDAGLTGRKIIVDTYGGMGRHGGGAFSRQGPVKGRPLGCLRRALRRQEHRRRRPGRALPRFRSPTRSARPSRFRSRSRPSAPSASVAASSTSWSIEHFDLRPGAFREYLDLHRPIYGKTAAYGHFGRDDADFTWEKTDKADALREAAGVAGRQSTVSELREGASGAIVVRVRTRSWSSLSQGRPVCRLLSGRRKGRSARTYSWAGERDRQSRTTDYGPLAARAVRLPAAAESMQGTVEVGSILMVPFARRRILGVVTDMAATSDVPPEKLAEPIKALGAGVPPQLVELGLWVADAVLLDASARPRARDAARHRHRRGQEARMKAKHRAGAPRIDGRTAPPR